MKNQKSTAPVFSALISIIVLFCLVLIFDMYEKNSMNKSNDFLGEYDVSIEKFNYASFAKYIEELGIEYPAGTIIRYFECTVSPNGTILDLNMVLDSESYSGNYRNIFYSKNIGYTKVKTILEPSTENQKITDLTNLHESRNLLSGSKVYVLSFIDAIGFFLSSDKNLDKNFQNGKRIIKYRLSLYGENKEAMIKKTVSQGTSVYTLNNGSYNFYTDGDEVGDIFLQVCVKDSFEGDNWLPVSEYELEVY